jgi:hypothetical protein
MGCDLIAVYFIADWIETNIFLKWASIRICYKYLNQTVYSMASYNRMDELYR